MKTTLFASLLALAAGAGTASASVTIYTDGSTYDSATGVTMPPKQSYAMSGTRTATDAPVWHKAEGPKVVRFGPPESGNGGA